MSANTEVLIAVRSHVLRTNALATQLRELLPDHLREVLNVVSPFAARGLAGVGAARSEYAMGGNPSFAGTKLDVLSAERIETELRELPDYWPGVHVRARQKPGTRVSIVVISLNPIAGQALDD